MINEVLLNILKKEPIVLSYLPRRLRNDSKFMLKAIEIDHFCCMDASEELRNNPEFMLEACKIDSFCYRFASEELKKDLTFNSRIKENVPEEYYFANLSSFNNFMEYEEYIEKYKNELRANPQLIYQIPNAFYNDLNFMIEVAKINPDIINVAPTSLQDNIQFVILCENTKINQIKVSRVNRTGELSMQDKMLDYIENLQIQLMDEKRKNLIIKSQINMQNNYAQPLEEMGGISHGQR